MKVPFSVDLTGKTAIVTGGSGVLCSAMAYGLAVNGAKVAIIGRNKEKLAKMSETLTENAKNEYSKEATVKGYSCNVLDKEELVKTYEQIKAELGSCDILINGAGGNRDFMQQSRTMICYLTKTVPIQTEPETSLQELLWDVLAIQRS